MQTAEHLGVPLVPIERVAEPKRETSDKATRDMISLLRTDLVPRFPLLVGDQAIEFGKGLMHVDTVSPTLGKKNRLALRTTPEYELNPRDHVEIISGMCLFGVSGLQGITESGEAISLVNPRESKKIKEPLVDVQMSPMLHVSEQDTLYRVIKTTEALHDASTTHSSDPNMSIRFHVPIPEYHLYMADLHRRDLMSDELYYKTSLMILKRGHALGQLLKKRIPANIPMEIMSPLQDFLPLLTQLPQHGRVTAKEFARHVASNNEYFDAVDVANKNTSYGSIGQLSYTLGYLLTALSAKESGSKPLAVDIAEEKPILEAAVEAADKMGVPLHMGALTIAPQIVQPTGEHNNMATFLHDMGGSSSLRQLLAVAITNSNM